jgi:hypothetical protein
VATSGQDARGLLFGDFKLATFIGNVFNDLNGNGMQNAGEPGLANWTIQLLDSAGTVVANDATDASGSYSFSNIGPGTYTVKEMQQSGWSQTAPASPGTYTVVATSGQDVSGLLFGDFKLAMFSGNVFNDLNGNGVQNAGEPGLPTWTVELLNPSGHVVASTVTNKNGLYSFKAIYPGTFTVAEIEKWGWHQTTLPTVYAVQANSGASVSGLTFGDQVGAGPHVVVGGIGGGVGSLSMVPTAATDLSVPTSYLHSGPSAVAVVVPGVSQPSPVKVVYDGGDVVATGDEASVVIQALFVPKNKLRATRGRNLSAEPGAKTGLGGTMPPLGIPGLAQKE